MTCHNEIEDASRGNLEAKKHENTNNLSKPITERKLLLPHLDMPIHHDVRAENISSRRLLGNIAAAIDRGSEDFSKLLLTPKVGARTIFALAMVAEVIHGAPYRFSDPVRFSLAHRDKNRHPFPVPIKVYDETIRILKTAVQKAKLGENKN